MKQIVLSLITMIATTGAAQVYNMEITMKNGSVQTVPAEEISEVKFVEVSGDNPEEFNILTKEYIPDPVLLAEIKEQVAAGKDVLTNIEAANYTGALILNDTKVQNFEGIGYFTSLKSLEANSIFAKKLDLSMLKDLEDLSINRSLVETLTLGSDKLKTLNIGHTGLKNFDISLLPKDIKDINVDNLEFTELDFTSFEELEAISCAQNMLTELKVAGLSKLKKIIFTTNNLTEISFAGCTALEFAAGSYNLQLVNVDLSGCSNIRNFMFMYTALESFDATPFASTLEELNLGWTNVKHLTLGNCSNLTYLGLDNCGLTDEVNFSLCPKLSVLRVDGTEIPQIDLSGCSEIAEIQCSTNNSLKSLKLASHLPKLFQLNIDNVPMLEHFEWGKTDVLEYANIYCTSLDRLDISNVNKDYRNLYFDYNDKLQEIKVWEGFDINNPPANIQKPANTKFVYEFTND